jgi:type IV pilus assembly protein PilO
LKKTEQGLREAYLNKKALAINLSVYKVQMEEMYQTFGTMLRQLPNTNEVPDLLIDITQAGLGRGLEFVLFKPEKEKPIDFYAELPIRLTVSGSYHELGQFVSDVAILPRIVTLSEISMSPANDKNKLTMSALAKTYRYVEAETPKIEAPKVIEAPKTEAPKSGK